MNKYNLSITVCTYNNEDSIIRTIESIPNREDIQIIIVNDGSKDNTHKVIIDYINNNLNRNIKYIRHLENYGVGAARKTAQKYIDGKYFTAIGADDWFLTNNLNFIIDNYINLNYDLIFFNMSRNAGYETKIMTEENWKLFCGSVKLIRTSFIKENNIEWHGIRCGEDFDFDRQYWYLNPTRIFTNIIAKHWNSPNEKCSNITMHGAINKEEAKIKIKEYSKTYNAKILKNMKLMKDDLFYLATFKPNFKEENAIEL